MFGQKRIRALESQVALLEERLEKEEKRNGKIEKELETVKKNIPDLRWKTPIAKQLPENFRPSNGRTKRLTYMRLNFAIVMNHLESSMKKVTIEKRLFDLMNIGKEFYVSVFPEKIMISKDPSEGAVRVSSHEISLRRAFYLSGKTGGEELENGYYPVVVTQAGLIIRTTKLIRHTDGVVFDKDDVLWIG